MSISSVATRYEFLLHYILTLDPSGPCSPVTFRQRETSNVHHLTPTDPFSFSVHRTSYATMPPHLHPRSRSTSSLFAGTLLASLLVVGIPHLFPCPAPRRTLADSQMIITEDGQQIQRIRRRRRKDADTPNTEGDALPQIPQATDEEVSTFLQLEAEAERIAHTGRECPVPKPRGVLGELLGFSGKDSPPHQPQQLRSGISPQESS